MYDIFILQFYCRRADMFKTIKRLVTNKIYMCNTLAAIFYMFGFMPFWIYTPKYIEVQYHTTASRASFFTGKKSYFLSFR
jgi:organic anion transporter 5A